MLFLKRLMILMFYASLPLLIPFGYSIFLNDGAWATIGFTILVMALPAVPQLLQHIYENIRNFVLALVQQDTAFTFARLVDLEKMREEVSELTLGQILALVSAAWLIIPAVSAIPYLAYGMGPVDAFFESLSGWTSTGLSAIPVLDGLPSSILLYRSVTQWVGGLGIVILMLTVMKGREAKHFLKAEGRTSEEVGISKAAGSIWGTYLMITTIGIVLLIVSGIDPINSVNLTFSGVSSGGFFPFDSFAFNDLQKTSLTVLMFCGATSFLIYRKLAAGKVREALLDEELIFYVLIAALAIMLIWFVSQEDVYNTLLTSISSISSTGFEVGDLPILHAFPIYILIVLMLMGGMMGSTCGGIKLWRILVVLKSIFRNVKSAFLPAGTVQVVKINGKAIAEESIVESSTFIFAYMIIFLFGCGVFIAADYGIEDSMFMIASAMGNVGLAIIPIPLMGQEAKIFLIILMYLGRIEIFPSLALIRFLTKR
ncbi:TrkH family potassium uptake protein [Candidatus Micrarchaeota archaeon]|nr:TrkH family potassium uptake protein [Candidatus Micrarchaeota archaeon]